MTAKMNISVRSLFKGSLWTVGSFGIGQALRFVTSIILARLLSPQLFGIMVIVNSFRTGIELISDVGISQNIVFHKKANEPEFYNTAWTIQAIRSLALWLIAALLASPIAHFYQTPILVIVAPLTAFSIVLLGFTSIAVPLTQKRFQLVRLNIFETIVAVISSVAVLLFAYLTPTIWALVFGGLFTSAVTLVGSYFLLDDLRQRFYLSKQYTWEILHYGKWVFVSSIVYFLSTNFDRLYLAKIIALNLLGVYGIARSISELFGAVILRLGNYVLFPLIASHAQAPRSDLREQLLSIRRNFLILVGTGISIIVAIADLPIKILYDERYQAAAWMLPFLIIGAWFSVLANINEATLLGLGKPLYSAIANTSKFIFLLIGLPLGVTAFGLLGGILIVVLSDLFRYFPFLIGQRREHFSFGAQDLYLTLLVFLLSTLFEWLRWSFGLGYSFESLPSQIGGLFSSGQ